MSFARYLAPEDAQRRCSHALSFGEDFADLFGTFQPLVFAQGGAHRETKKNKKKKNESRVQRGGRERCFSPMVLPERILSYERMAGVSFILVFVGWEEVKK